MADVNNRGDSLSKLEQVRGMSPSLDPNITSNPTTTTPIVATTTQSPSGETLAPFNLETSPQLESRPRGSGSVFEKIIPSLQTHEKLYYRLYFLFRYFTIFTAIFLAIISTLYGISNMTTLEVENFFCPFYSADQVHQHNIKNENNEGDDELGCWFIERYQLNRDTVESLNIDVYEAYLDENATFGDILACIIFGILTLFLLFISIQYGFYLIYDTYYAIINDSDNGNLNPRVIKCGQELIKQEYKQKKLQKQKQKRQNLKNIKNAKKKNVSKKAKNSQDIVVVTSKSQLFLEYCCNITNTIIKPYTKYLAFRERKFYFDSKWLILSTIWFECFEIFIQLCALLLYGGISIFDINSLILSQSASIVQAFSTIVGLNTIMAGISWILYVAIPSVFHGGVFFTLLFIVDTIFEIIYILFPLIYLTSSDAKYGIFDIKSLGLLKQENSFYTVQSLFALIFLSSKCYQLMYELDPVYIQQKHWQLKKELQKLAVNQRQNGQPNQQKIKKVNKHKKPWIIDETNDVDQCTHSFCVLILSIFFYFLFVFVVSLFTCCVIFFFYVYRPK